MKSITLSLLMLVLIITLAIPGCTGNPPPALPAATQAPPAATEAPPAPTVAAPKSAGSLAVILTGPWNDHSWNESAYVSAKSLEKKGVKVGISESVSNADVARVLRQYAEEGYEVIIGHSYGYGDAVFEVAKEYPKTSFAWAGGINKTAKNVADYDQPYYQMEYPLGILAGYMSKTGKLGALYGFDVPVCHSEGVAFLAGARTVNPSAQLIVSEVGDWVDVAKGKEAGLAQADAGVDYWVMCGESAALGALEAAKERGGYVTGHVGDFSEIGKEHVLAGMIWNLEPIFQIMLDQTHAGTFNAPWYSFGVKEGGVELKWNDSMKSQVPPEAVKAVEQAIADIKSGKFVVEYVPE